MHCTTVQAPCNAMCAHAPMHGQPRRAARSLRNQAPHALGQPAECVNLHVSVRDALVALCGDLRFVVVDLRRLAMERPSNDDATRRAHRHCRRMRMWAHWMIEVATSVCRAGCT